MRIIRDIKAVLTSHRAARAMEAGKFESVHDIFRDYDAPRYLLSKAMLLRAMAYHRQHEYQLAVECYDAFLSDHVENMIPKDRNYTREYALFFRSRAASKIDPSIPLYSSVEDLRKLARTVSPLTRNEFKV
jgi:outer membrane protein assembly factor BamD (BamD/ComL family)